MITPAGEKIVIAGKIIFADNFTRKLFGLAARGKLKEDECMLFENCRSIHTFWMRYPIDAAFLNRDRMVLRIFTGLKPFRITPFVAGGYFVLEFMEGAAKMAGIRKGYVIEW